MPALSEPGRVGALVISLDFELHWGVRSWVRVDGPYRQRLLGVWDAIPKILALFQTYGIAATWATVGMLMAECRDELIAYSPEARPSYSCPELDPYQETVGYSEGDDPFHYAPSLVRLISCTARQEICTHTFSHYYCREAGQTEREFRADIGSATRIAAARGLKISSIVFPLGQVNRTYAGVLRDFGLTVYRDRQSGFMYRCDSLKKHDRAVFRLARLADSYCRVSGHNVVSWSTIPRSGGISGIGESRFLRAYNPGLKIFDGLKLRRINNGITAAAKTGGVYHLWWHPHNFGKYLPQNLAFLEAVLQHFAACRDLYGMRSLNMMEAATWAPGL